MTLSLNLLTSGNKFCRACLSTGDNVPFVDVGAESRYFEELSIPDIALPKSAVLCNDCDLNIMASLTFRDKVIQSALLLKSIIETIHDVSMHDFDVKSEASEDSIWLGDTVKEENDEEFVLKKDYIIANGRKGTRNAVKKKSRKKDIKKQEYKLKFGAPDSDEVKFGVDRIWVNDELVKDEDDDDEDLIPLQFVKKECTVSKENKRTSRTFKKKKSRKKVDNEVPKEDKRTALTAEDKLKCTLICLTKEEQKQELRQKADERKFVNSLYKCHMCFKGFCFEETFKKHMALHEPSYGPYKCDVCQLHFASKHYYMSHLLRHSKRFKCLKCSVVKCTRKDLLEHYGADHDKDRSTLECAHCAKIFLKPTILRQHINRRHRNNNVRQTCEHCGKTFRTKEILRRHLLQHTTRNLPEKEKRFECKTCGDKFITPTFLRIHEVKHSDDRNFYCTLCDTYFKSQTILKSHLKYSSRHADINKTVPCQHCDKKMSSKRELEKHVEKDHLGIANFKCELCPKAYYTNNLLRMHFRRVHEKYRPPMKHVCDYCGKTFNVRSTLIGHINTHTGEKPYACKECSARFGHSAALYTHVRLVHRKMKRDDKGRFHVPSS